MPSKKKKDVALNLGNVTLKIHITDNYKKALKAIQKEIQITLFDINEELEKLK